ncbi:MAG: hypothetical protein EA355_09530 [Rhodobacteraceae bacterium]|nr:MAG: hypothetical protein EA355_09530 [Paracoccaceae bacterium]
MKQQATLWAAFAFAGVLATGASAAPFVLEDLNSRLSGDTAGGGVTEWRVNGVNHLFQEWFWIRVDGTSLGDREHRLSSFDILAQQTTDTNTFTDPRHDNLNVVYNIDGLLRAEVSLSLRGSQCCGSDLAEQVSIVNTSGGALSFSFFEYTDFDLGGTSFDTFADFTPTATGGAFRQDDDTGIWRSTTVVTPRPSFWEIAYYATTLGKLDDDMPTTLSNTVSPLLNGDLTWAAQWNVTLNDGQTWLLSKDKLLTPIPLPAPAFLLLGGLAALGALKRRAA